MRAIRYEGFGGPEVLRLVDVPVPEPGPRQVRVAVKVAAVKGIDWKIREGYLGEQPMPQRPGVELAGVVDAAGPDAHVGVGDEVFGWAAAAATNVPGWDGGFPAGAYADYALAEVVIRKPEELTRIQLPPCRSPGRLPCAGFAGSSSRPARSCSSRAEAAWSARSPSNWPSHAARPSSPPPQTPTPTAWLH